MKGNARSGHHTTRGGVSMLASSYPLLDLFWTMLEIFMFVIYLWLMIAIFSDIFRSHDMGGVAKMIWVLFIIILPFLGILAYLILRGSTMHERVAAQAAHQQKAFDDYIKQTAGISSATKADELVKLADLKTKGVLTDAEFEAVT
jgi:hypothetical protein